MGKGNIYRDQIIGNLAVEKGNFPISLNYDILQKL